MKNIRVLCNDRMIFNIYNGVFIYLFIKCYSIFNSINFLFMDD